MECLLQEAQSVASLRHPNIVQVYDVAEYDGFPYYAMELLEGGDLANMLQGKPRAARDAAELVRVLAGAVHAAHRAGIVHRDLKPGNILLDFDKTPKIGDFSLSRKVDGDSTILTHIRLAGTPSYMAPEQAAGKPSAIKPAVDIYSLGAVLYELLTGRPPFSAETSAETRRQVIDEEPVPPTRLNTRIPRDLQTICLKCLQKDPSRRYLSAADLAEDLARFLQGEPIHARPVGFAERTVKWCNRHRATSLALLAVAAMMTGAVAVGAWLQQVEHARQTEAVIRREGARTSIESALPLLSEFVKSRQWSDAERVLSVARARLSDANSRELEDRTATAAEELEVAQELDRIRQSFPEPNVDGYSYKEAREAYARVFRRVGIGSDVEVYTASQRVRASPLREQLLTALDHAAFTERLQADSTEFSRLLAVGRAAAPNPWQGRFRDPATWRNLSSLQRLVTDASNADPSPPSHQMVMIGILLGSLDEINTSVEVLHEAQLRDPSDFWINIELGKALKRVDQNTEALQFYRAAVALRPEHYVAWTSLGHQLIFLKRHEEAAASLQRAVALQPEFALSWQNLIVALSVCERWDDALAVGRKAASIDPAFVTQPSTKSVLHQSHARSSAARQEWSNAAEACAQALNGFYANHSEIRFELAATSVLAGDESAYREASTWMLEQHKSARLRSFLVARACTLATVPDQHLDRAAKICSSELDGSADSYWSLTQRAALLCRQGRHEEAKPLLERSLQASSQPEHNVITWAWLSRVQLGLGDHDAAKQWLGKAATYLDQSKTKPPAIHLHNWLEAHILRREVETLLQK